MYSPCSVDHFPPKIVCLSVVVRAISKCYKSKITYMSNAL